MNLAIIVILFIAAILLWRKWWHMKTKKWKQCIVCGTKTNHDAAFCSKDCADKCKQTNFQQSYIRHRNREIEYLRKRNIEKWGNLIGERLPIFVDDGPPRLTLNEWEETLRFFSYTCCYCGIKISRGSATFEHVQPLSLGGLFIAPMIIPACQSCNSSRGVKPLKQFYEDKPVHPRYIRRIDKFLKQPFWLELHR